MTNEGMTNQMRHQSPSNSIRRARLRSPTAMLAVGAAFLASVTAVRSQGQDARILPAARWLYTQPADVAAGLAKAAAGQQALARGARAVPAAKATGTFITFDVPGSINGVYPVSVNPGGDVTGYYYDANYLGHGFVRTKNGTVTTFDVPSDVNGSYPSGIDPQGVITGYYCDVNNLCHGFVRTPDGVITLFDPANIAGTYPFGIAPTGVVTGYYYDAKYVGRGFVRAPTGTLITFGVSGAVNGTYPVSINVAGISGTYVDASYVLHGFVRTASGVSSFDPPGRLGFFAPYSFGPGLGISPTGSVAGYYFETIAGNPFGGNYRGFLRTPDGTLTTFDAGSETVCCIWTFPYSINLSGAMTGSYNDSSSINHGFVRSAKGTLTTLDAPGAGTGFNQGTASLSINAAGVTTGLYIDADYGYHGFLFQP